MCDIVNGKASDLHQRTDLPTVLKKESALIAFTGWLFTFETAAEVDI
jgi:hypothetical protein